MAVGGLGGLGGWNQTFGDILSGLGQSLLSSPSNNMFQGFPAALQGIQAKRKEQRSDEAMVTALISAGLPPDKAMALAVNPTAAALVINQQNSAKQQAFREKAMQGLGGPLTPPGDDSISALEGGIKAAESGGNYGAVGPLVKQGNYAGERAQGAYQVMPGNIPKWTEEHVGKRLTPEEFRANPEAQDKVFRGEMQKNLAKYGTIEDAASIWFTGVPYAEAVKQGRTDGFLKVQEYVAKVKANMGGGGAPAAVAGAPGAPVQVAAAGGKFPVPLPDRSIPTAAPTQPAGVNRTQAYASQQAQQALRMMIAAGDDKPTMEAAKQSFQHWSKYLTPTDAQRNLQAAGISPTSDLGRDILSGGATINREKLKIDQAKLRLEQEGFDWKRYQEDREYRAKADDALRTSDTRNYEFYKRDQLSRGEPVKPFQQWAQEDGGAKAAKTIVQMGEADRDKVFTKRFSDMMAEGDAAATDLGLVRQLRDLGGAINPKTLPALRGWLADQGVKVGDDIGVIEAYNSAINRLTPAQRQGLPGAASERDVTMFKSSLPRLINTPGGNAIINDTLEALALHKQQRAQIAEEAIISGDYKTANQKLRELPDPYATFKDFRSGAVEGESAEAPKEPPMIYTGKQYDALPVGSEYRDAKGNLRRKSQDRTP